MACSNEPVSANKKLPTYGFLIDLFGEYGEEPDKLLEKFKDNYPEIYIGRPDRFYNTMKRIVTPTLPSSKGKTCPVGLGPQLAAYRKKLWEPRLRNTSKIGGTCKFPEELYSYGLNEELLAASFRGVQMGEKPKWHLKGIPNIDFYMNLHPILKRWPVTESATKVAIGTFYIEIDENMKKKGSRPDNVYWFVDKTVKSNRSLGHSLMAYHPDDHQTEMRALRSDLSSCTKQVGTLNADVSELKQQLEASRQELQVARCALRDVTNERQILVKQKETCQKNFEKSKKVQFRLEEEITSLHLENVDLSMALSDLESDLCEENSSVDSYDADTHDSFTFQTKNGRQYSPAIRKLYYTLLANQVPTVKISEIIKSVVKCFNPSIDVDCLKLPQRSCASYMRREEMKTICSAHNAAILCDQSNQKKPFHLNTDGTTKCQKKLGALAINDVVISVNELSDGTANTAVTDITKELQKLRSTAHILGLPNPDSINWTVIASATSDSAATQKRLNALVEECRKADEEQFGAPQIEVFELIENFCSMHLGVNLRKAFLNGLKHDASQDRQHPLDVLVHEFCKTLGQHGVPEYGCGANFLDFLTLMSKNADTAELRTYYQKCSMERQVGNRYFVSASNAAKIFFLRCAALEFLKYSGKGLSGNKLEQSVYEKLLSSVEIVSLKADSLMFYRVYADIVMLSKSTTLNKSAMDMNHHYLELLLFLQEAEKDPIIVHNKDFQVFRSEGRLYGDLKEVNYRIRQESECIFNYLFSSSDCDDDTLFQLLSSGISKMREKLQSYAHSRLPGGMYWDPEPAIRNELSNLKPTNDLCESILGMNDYLTTALPNLHQLTRSNLVQAKKNKTIKWLDNLTDAEQGKVIELAVRSRKSVKKSLNEEEEERSRKRQQNLVDSHMKREAARQKLLLEKEKLSHVQLVTSSKELKRCLCEIDAAQEISPTKRKAQKLAFLKAQIKFRKKVLEQNIHITFSHCGRQKSIDDILQELADFIDSNPYEYAEYLQNPSALVGKHVSHQFELPNCLMKWYNGTVLKFDCASQQHTILYEDEDQPCSFDLIFDLLNGDLKIL